MATWTTDFNAAAAQAAGYAGTNVAFGRFSMSSSYSTSGETVDFGGSGQDMFSLLINVIGESLLVKTALSPDAWLVRYVIESSTIVRITIWNPTTGAEAPAATNFSGVDLFSQLVGSAIG